MYLQHVVGEVYSIDEKMLQTLDKFEGYPTLYKRRLEIVQPTTNGSDDALSAWIFVFHSFNEELLSDTLYETYICKNYDTLRSLSGKFTPEERAEFFKELRSDMTNIDSN